MGRVPSHRRVLLLRGGAAVVAIITIWFWPLGGAPRVAPSFDCAKATIPAEKAICADPALSKIDADFAAYYQDNLQTAAGFGDTANVETLKKDEQAFIETRNHCGAAKWCIERAYGERDLKLEQLGGAPKRPTPRGVSRRPANFLGAYLLRHLKAL